MLESSWKDPYTTRYIQPASYPSAQKAIQYFGLFEGVFQAYKRETI